MAMEIFRLVGSIFVDNSEANKSISKTDEKAQGVGKTLLNGVGTAVKWGAKIAAGATAATTAVAALSSTTVKSFAENEQLVGGVETLFKDSADVIFGYADEAYKTAGLTANQYMDTITGFSASLLQGLNGDTAKAAEIANMAIIDMSDNANKMGSDMSSIQNAYQGFAKQNYTMLDNLKLGYGGTKEEMNRLLADAEKLSGKKYDISSLNDVYEAIHVIQTEMGVTGTTAEEASTTISGNINMIKGKFENFKVTIGTALAPVVKKFLALITDNLPKVENMVNKITPIISDLMEKLLPPIMELADQLLPILVDLFNVLMPIFSDIIAMILPPIIELIQLLLPPIVEIVQKLLPPLLELIEPILGLLSPLIELLEPILDLIIGILSPLTELISDLLTPLVEIASQVIEFALAPLKEYFGYLADLLSGAVSTAFELIMNQVDTIKGVFSGLIDFITGIFSGDWEKAWDGVKKIFGSIWEGIKGLFKIPINWIIDGINLFIRGLNKIKVPDWVPLIGGYGFDIKEIPNLYAGGVLEKGQTGFLEGNGAEAVVPLENNRKWISAVAKDMDVAVGGASGKEVASILKDILNALYKIMGLGIYLDGDKLVGGIGNKMDAQLGLIQARKVRA